MFGKGGSYMLDDQNVDLKAALLDDLAMKYETAVMSLPAEKYLDAFYSFFETKNRNLKLIPSPEGFPAALQEVSGCDVWRPIAEKTESLFGLPRRVTVFEDDAALRGEMGGTAGRGPFFFIFDRMFREYDAFTLRLISGTNY